MPTPRKIVPRVTIARMRADEWLAAHGMKHGSLILRLIGEGQVIKTKEKGWTYYHWADVEDEKPAVAGARPIVPEAVPTPSEPPALSLYDAERDRWLARSGPGGAFVNQLGPRVREILYPLVASLSTMTPEPPPDVTPMVLPVPSGDAVVYLGLTDLHFGLGDAVELGAEIDAQVDANLGPAILAYGRPAHIILPVGSDALHVDRHDRTTTKGTAVHPSMRTVEAYDHAVAWYARTVQRLRAIAGVQVHLVYCAGNHDRVLSHTVMAHMHALYGHAGDVVMHREGRDWTTAEIGGMLWHVEHGDRRVGPKSGEIMARHPAWSRSSARVLLRGHRHHFAATDREGIVEVQCRAMSRHSEYDEACGWGTPRGVTVVVAVPGRGVVGIQPG